MLDMLDFFMGKWEIFGETGAILICKMKKKEGRNTRQANVIIMQIINEAYLEPEKIGKYFIIAPSRKKNIAQAMQSGPFFDSLKEAKSYAQEILHAYLSLIMSGKINWWTQKERLQ